MCKSLRAKASTYVRLFVCRVFPAFVFVQKVGCVLGHNNVVVAGDEGKGICCGVIENGYAVAWSRRDTRRLQAIPEGSVIFASLDV